MVFLGSTSLICLAKQRKCSVSLYDIVGDLEMQLGPVLLDTQQSKFFKVPFEFKIQGLCIPVNNRVLFHSLHCILVKKKRRGANIQRRIFLTPNQVIPGAIKPRWELNDGFSRFGMKLIKTWVRPSLGLALTMTRAFGKSGWKDWLHSVCLPAALSMPVYSSSLSVCLF